MAERELRLVRRGEGLRPAGRTRGALLASVVVIGAAWSTQVGVQPARRALEVRTLAEQALQRSLERGLDDPRVRATLRELRREVSRRPLDSRARVVYAGVLLGLSSNLDDTAAAAFHAEVAARLAPATVPVVRGAVLVLARSGRRAEAVEWTRRMFGHDADAAADLLLRLEPYLSPAEIEEGLENDPEAWLAWSRRLRQAERGESADRWIERAFERWPGREEVRRLMCARAVRRGDWDGLARLVPAEAPLAESAAAAPLWVYRARVRSRAGDGADAVRDIETAQRLGRESNDLMILAGEAYESMDLLDEARSCWTRVLFRTPAGARDNRVRVLVSLARLEQRSGDLSSALRHWRAVLAIEPGHEAALRQIARLTGGPP